MSPLSIESEWRSARDVFPGQDFTLDFLNRKARIGLQATFRGHPTENPLNTGSTFELAELSRRLSEPLHRYSGVMLNNHIGIFSHDRDRRHVTATTYPDVPHKHLHNVREDQRLRYSALRKTTGPRFPTAIGRDNPGMSILQRHQEGIIAIVEFGLSKLPLLLKQSKFERFHPIFEQGLQEVTTARELLHKPLNDACTSMEQSFVLDVAHNTAELAMKTGPKQNVAAWCRTVQKEFWATNVMAAASWHAEGGIQTFIINDEDLHWRTYRALWEQINEDTMATLDVCNICEEKEPEPNSLLV